MSSANEASRIRSLKSGAEVRQALEDRRLSASLISKRWNSALVLPQDRHLTSASAAGRPSAGTIADAAAGRRILEHGCAHAAFSNCHANPRHRRRVSAEELDLARSLRIDEGLLETAITSCDHEVQRLQQTLYRQCTTVHAQQERMAHDLSRKEQENGLLRQDLASADRRFQRHLQALVRKQTSLTSLVKELYKHMQPLARFQALLKRLDAAGKIAALDVEPPAFHTSRTKHVESNPFSATDRHQGIRQSETEQLDRSARQSGSPTRNRDVVLTADAQGERSIVSGRQSSLASRYPYAESGNDFSSGNIFNGDLASKSAADSAHDTVIFLQSNSIDDQVTTMHLDRVAHHETIRRLQDEVHKARLQLEGERNAFEQLLHIHEVVRAENAQLVSRVKGLQRDAECRSAEQGAPLAARRGSPLRGLRGPRRAESVISNGANPPSSAHFQMARGTKVDYKSLNKKQNGLGTWNDARSTHTDDMKMILGALNHQRSILFSFLSTSEQHALLAGNGKYPPFNYSILKMRKDEIVYQQGTEVAKVWLVISGEIELWVSHARVDRGGQQVEMMMTSCIHTVQPGETIGDVDFVLRRPHLASAIVRSDNCQLVEMCTVTLKQMLMKYPAMGTNMMKQSLHERSLLSTALPSSDDHTLTEHTALLTDLRTASEAWALCNHAVFR